MVATDSYRLSVKHAALESAVSQRLEANIPARALRELARIIATEAVEEVEIALPRNQIVFGAGEVLLSSRLIEGQFPSWRQLIPESFEHEVRLPREELLEITRRVSQLAQRNAPLRLAFAEGELTVAAETPDIGDASEAMPAPYSGEPLEIAFNPQFLVEGIESVGSEEARGAALVPTATRASATGRRRGLQLPRDADSAQHLVGPMVVDAVSVLDLRNLVASELALGPGLNLLWGPNGAGKTNLLEATYMALAGRSCRTRDERETIAFGKPLARAQVMIADDGRRRAFLFSVSRSDGRRHLVDGAPATAESAARRPSLAVFMPDRLALVKGPPSARRNHLDSFSAALWPARAQTRRRYSRALAQRNALLGRIRAGAGSRSSLDAWDLELAESGVRLIADRAQACERLATAFEPAARALGLAGEPVVRYRPRSEADDPAQLAAELGERRESDLSRGYTGWGPHLDELALEAGGRSLRRYGSQGQRRTARWRCCSPSGARWSTPGACRLPDVARRRHQRVSTATTANSWSSSGDGRRSGADHGHRLRAAAGIGRPERDRGPRRPRPRPGRERAGRMSRRPRALAEAVGVVRDATQPATLLAAVQSRWEPAVGARVAREAHPVREREGTVTISCRAATWAQELDLLQEELLEALNRALAPRRVQALRFVVGETPPRDRL